MKHIAYGVALVALCGMAVQADEAMAAKNSPTDITEDYVGKFGAGIILGEPTGLSVKYWLNQRLAIDGAAGWSIHDDSEFYLHSDLLVHKFDLIPVPEGKLPVYLGGGAFVRFREGHHDDELGVRVPVGVSYMFENLPLDIFAEIAPGIELAPSTRIDVSGGIGIRYWF